MRQNQLDKAMLFLIFSDPLVLGMTFIGALILFERADRTIDVIVITPLKRWQYLWSKAISLTLVAVVCSIIMAAVSFGLAVPWFWFLLSIALSSVIFIFLGFVIVASCTSFYQYLLKMGIFMIPVSLPLLNFIELTDTKIWYLVPTQATLILMETLIAAQSTGNIIYAVFYLVIWCIGSYYFASRAFERYLSQ